eukprot:TRINITY_DN12679_c0_g1_i1.p1 TRINITY_DN12679_c0_g1~~TRINITY_DN12679_c0_g1_i1.p1  ORF type:complete len:476 (-),score=127.73 TRINITY_DN12679_c0_g1_i1:90-1517(-)
MAAAEVTDRFGLALATAEGACAEAVGAYYEAVLAYKPFAAWRAASEEAVAADAACPMAQLVAADCAFCQGEAGRAEEILKKLQAQENAECGDDAPTGGRSWSWRERRYLEAWSCWVLRGDPAGCFEALREVIARHPEDLFAVKRAQIMGLILGDGSRILAAVEPAASAAAAASPPPRYLHGMWAFGLEQEGRYEEAEAKAREGLQFEATLGPDAWLDHGLAHALYFQGDDRLDEALEFLQERSANWGAEALHPFLFTHCWWHLSLLHCEKRSFEDAYRIFDERLWPDSAEGAERGKDPQVQLNALNLLWRLETRGESSSTRPRWRKVLDGCRGISLPPADESAGRGACQHADLLLDVLLVRGLAAGAKEDASPLEAFLTAAEAHADSLAASAGGANGRADAYRSIVRLVAELYRSDQGEAGLAARQGKARSELRALQPRWSCLGGSEEQRGILLEAVEGAIVCGEFEKNYTQLFM